MIHPVKDSEVSVQSMVLATAFKEPRQSDPEKKKVNNLTLQMAVKMAANNSNKHKRTTIQTVALHSRLSLFCC